jgi:hypothetical protein
MIFYFILLLSLFVTNNASSFNSLIVHTKFNNVSQLLSEIIKPTFYSDYLKIIEADDITYFPDITNLTEIVFPLKIKYKCHPKITLIPKHIGKIEIEQVWSLNDIELSSEVSSHYINFTLKIIPFKYYDNISLIFQGILKEKKFYVPLSVINDIIISIEQIFQELIHKNCNK